jgi:hypothetical protein
MSVRQLVWAGRLMTVEVPKSLVATASERAQWAYAQAIATGREPSEAMRAALAVDFPGLGYGVSKAQPLPFSAAVNGLETAVSFAESDMSSRSGPHRSPTQMRTPPDGGRGGNGGVSGNGGQRTRSPLFSTSSGSSPRVHGAKEGHRQPASRPPKPTATPRTVGWMGSGTTNA